ncbi:MAG TPA: PKD domain-containing protein [Candidatus Paceibacterota bacterium]|nr:PKD domain-containing protein [Candidatus Paceibacterota bacterium]
MIRKYASFVVGLVILASPIITSAQTTSTNSASIIAALEQLVATLTSELQALIAARGQSTTAATSRKDSNFYVSPTSAMSGPAPLTVSFTASQNAGSGQVNFGDRSTSSIAAIAEGSPQTDLYFNHTYTSPGTYTATVTNGLGTIIGTTTVVVTESNSNTGNSFSCATFGTLQKGDTDALTNGQVSQLQSFLGISPTTGYYGAQTSIAYQNNCGNLNNAQPTSVPGMNKYTDSSFGFSFWYPSGWTISEIYFGEKTGDLTYYLNPDVKHLILSNGTTSIEIGENTSQYGIPTMECPTCMESIYFDSDTGQWMDHNEDRRFDADVSKNTMGGLHIFFDYAVPLSATNYVSVLSDGNLDGDFLINTIVATNPAVAIPVPTSQQLATIQTEASAYADQ